MKKTLKIVVLAKQVPDTRNVGKDAMKADGTVNRAALPAIFNPEDLNALEQALVLKDMFPGSRVDILTMGPGRAAEIIREGMFRGADGGVLLTDRKPGDTGIIETSYGVHVMYFDSFGKIYRDALVENALRSADYNAWYDATAGDGSYTTSAFGMKYTTK